MQVHHEIRTHSGPHEYTKTIASVTQALSSVMTVSLPIIMPAPPSPPETPDPRSDEDWVNVWILCDTRMLITSVQANDVDYLYDVWSDYDLDNRVGLVDKCRYGILEDFYDDRDA